MLAGKHIIRMKNENSVKCGCPCKKNGDSSQQLSQARRAALDDTAKALQSIISQQKLTSEINDQRYGNVLEAKKDVVDAMVNLAIASSEGSHSRIKEILSGYGLDDMI